MEAGAFLVGDPVNRTGAGPDESVVEAKTLGRTWPHSREKEGR